MVQPLVCAPWALRTARSAQPSWRKPLGAFDMRGVLLHFSRASRSKVCVCVLVTRLAQTVWLNSFWLKLFCARPSPKLARNSRENIFCVVHLVRLAQRTVLISSHIVIEPSSPRTHSWCCTQEANCTNHLSNNRSASVTACDEAAMEAVFRIMSSDLKDQNTLAGRRL